MLEYFTKCEDLDEPAQFIARYCGPAQVALDSGKACNPFTWRHHCSSILSFFCRGSVASTKQTIPL